MLTLWSKEGPVEFSLYPDKEDLATLCAAKERKAAQDDVTIKLRNLLDVLKALDPNRIQILMKETVLGMMEDYARSAALQTQSDQARALRVIADVVNTVAAYNLSILEDTVEQMRCVLLKLTNVYLYQPRR